MCVIDGIFKAFTRQGKEVKGLIEIEEDFKNIPDDTVLDGELLLRNDNNLKSKDLYRATMKEARKDGEKHNLTFNVFDILPLEDFKKGKCNTSCKERKEILHELFKNNDFKKFYKKIEDVLVNKVLDKEELDEDFKDIVAQLESKQSALMRSNIIVSLFI